MTAADQIDELGAESEIVSAVPGVDLANAVLNAQDGFVLSRIDGKTSLGDLCESTGIGRQTTIEVLKRLRQQGIIVVGNEKPVESNISALGGQLIEEPRRSPTTTEHRIVEEDNDLDPKTRQRIREVYEALSDKNFFELLGAEPDADATTLRRAYFKRSKEFHPDRYYTKKLGGYKAMLAEIFRQLNAAHEFLADDARRNAYRATIEQEVADRDLAAQTEEAVRVANREMESVEGYEESTSGEYGFVSRRHRSNTASRRAESSMGKPAVEPSEASAGVAVHREGDTGPQFPATEPPSVSATANGDDDARKERRERDRKRRRRATTLHSPVGARKRRAREFFERGMRQLSTGETAAAAASLKLASTYDPAEDEYGHRYGEAVEQSREATAESFFKRATFEESVGRYDAAAKLYTRAADLFPKSAYLLKAAEMMLAMEELIKAKEYATKAVQSDPESDVARLTLARVYLASGMKKNARREAETAVKLNAENRAARELLKQVRRA